MKGDIRRHTNFLIFSYQRYQFRTSGQDGGIGRYALLPHTTKRRTATNLKANNNQNDQKIELYGSLTTKELKKKYSSDC